MIVGICLRSYDGFSMGNSGIKEMPEISVLPLVVLVIK